MRHLILSACLLIFVGQCVRAQQIWTVPQFQVLSRADRIRRGRTPITDVERREIAHIVAAAFEECRKDPGASDPRTLTAFVGGLLIRKIDLGSQGQSAFVLEGWTNCECSADGNCEFWVLGEEGGHLTLLLNDGMDQFAIEKPKSGGYFDIITGWHDSATEQDLTRYEFSGQRYRRVACALMSYNGPNWTVLKTPHITPRPCQ